MSNFSLSRLVVPQDQTARSTHLSKVSARRRSPTRPKRWPSPEKITTWNFSPGIPGRGDARTGTPEGTGPDGT